MSQITVLLPDALAGALDAAVRELSRSRTDLVREAIERFLEDIDDLSVAPDGCVIRAIRSWAGMTSDVT